MSIFMTFRINWFKNYNYKSPISELKLLFIKLINNFFNGVYYILTYYDEDIGGLTDEVKKIREMVELPLKHPEIFDKYSKYHLFQNFGNIWVIVL